MDEPTRIISGVLAKTATQDRAKVLREIMIVAAGGLVVIEGPKQAAESVYRLADQIVTRGTS